MCSSKLHDHKNKYSMMKKVVLAAAAVLILAACNNSQDAKSAKNEMDSLSGVPIPVSTDVQPVDSASAPRIKFEKETYDFGTIVSGDKVTYSFKFKNVGKTPLIITNAEASCGCTVPEYPNKPVNPGEEGVIKVIYDSSGQTGMQNKVVNISSNAIPAVSELHLIGESKAAK